MVQFWWGEATDEPRLAKCAPAREDARPTGSVLRIGGARLLTSLGSSSRHPSLFSAPNQIKHPAFEWPVLDSFDQSFANGIFLHVNPLFRIIFTVAQPMMPAA